MKVPCKYVDLDIYPGARFCELFSGHIDYLEVISDCLVTVENGNQRYSWRARDSHTGQEFEYSILAGDRQCEPKLFNNDFEAKEYLYLGPALLEIMYKK